MRMKDIIFGKKMSGNAAKDRLRQVIFVDRIHCSPDTLEYMKRDLLQVLSKYIEMNGENLKLEIIQMDNKIQFSIFSPTKSLRVKTGKR